MKKFFRNVVFMVAVLVLVACGAKKAENEAGNNEVDIKIKGGTYVVPRDESSDSKYLALKLEIKNKSNQKLNISEGDVTLYDSEGEKISAVNVYDSSDKFKTLGYESLSKDKSLSRYTVFEVDPEEEYELHYSPKFIDSLAKDRKEIEIKVKPSKYTDQTAEIVDVAKEYVNKVFLSGDASGDATNVASTSSDKSVTLLAKKDKKKSKDDEKGGSDKFVLGGELEKDRAAFVKKFGTEFADNFSYYKPSDAELRTFIEAYTKVNAKRAKVSYSIKEFLPESATIYVRPETIGLENIRTYDLVSKFANEHRAEYSDYKDAYSAAEKYILEQAPSQFDSIPLVTSKYMNNEGYELKLVKKNKKWVVDTTDSNYDSLVRIFSGNI